MADPKSQREDGLPTPGYWRSREEALAQALGPVRYDISNDSWVAVTQDYLDKVEEFLGVMMVENKLRNRVDIWDKIPARLKLKTYPNPMRADGVFIAEDKPIEPYDNCKTWDGKPIYPATPKTQWCLGSQIRADFAQELVRRWNWVADFEEFQREARNDK